MMNKRYRSLFSLLLVISIFFTSFNIRPLNVYADKNGVVLTAGETAALDGEDVSANALKELKKVEIKTVEDLKELSEHGTSEAYSFGKRFVLMNDIDLTGSDYKPIAVMGGLFDGNGHTIKGFSLQSKHSDTGFFRAVSKTGRVQNLTIKGDIKPTGTMTNIGGIAGINYGTIANCEFDGEILAEEAVGGIAGKNMPSANIIKCKNHAEISATRRTGGIVGFNRGLIRDCMNYGEINAQKLSAEEQIDELKKNSPVSDKDDKKSGALGEDIEDDDEVEEGSLNLSKLTLDSMDLKDDDLKEAAMNEHQVTYTGGIAGVSEGTVYNCRNEGVVGYDHLGYNTGGIIGYERGVLHDCKNNAKIYGRKNVGGIVGEFEPYAENIYHDDKMDLAQEQIGELVDMTDNLNTKIGKEDDKMQQNIDSIRMTSDAMRYRIKEWKQYYRCKDDSVQREFRGKVDNLKDHINDLDYDVDDKKAKKAFKKLQSDMDTFANLLDQKMAMYSNPAFISANLISKGFDQIPEWLTFASTYGVTKDMYDQLDDIIDYIKENADELDGLVDDLKDIRSLTDDLDSYINSVVNDYKCDIRRTDDDITGYTDLIADQMDILAEGLKGSDKVIRDQLNKMVDQMHNVNDSLDDGFDEIDEEFAKLRDTENLNDVFDDISNSEDSVPSLGNIMRCENNGGITSDINGGGIAGYIDIDTGSQSDFEVVSGGNISLNYDRTQKATVLKCVNKGPVTVKNSYAGGIVGRADVGAVIKCENYAEVMTDEGDYSGGIVGKSAFVVRDNYSMSVVEGNDYVGGIAGYGRDLSGNHAMATIDMSEGEKRGAIAGDVDEDGVVGGNIVVGDLPAINGVTYTGQAENVEYKAFIGDTSTPKEFKTMTVTFMSHGGVVATKQVPYGGSIPYDEFPELGKSDEYFEVWENQDLNDIKQNVVVNSEEVTWTTTIASKEAFPQVLMIGNFYTGTTLEYERGKIPLRNVIEDYESLDNYTFNIESEYGLTSSEFECRILADDYDDIAEVALEKEGKVSIVNSRRDGRYMVFPYEEGDIVWIVRSNQKEIVKQISFWALVGGGAVLVILILFFIISRIIKRRKRKKAQMADNKE